MRELTSVEMHNVSGAGLFDFVGSVVVRAAASSLPLSGKRIANW